MPIVSSSRRSKLRVPAVLVAATLSVLLLAVTTAAEPLGDQFKISTRGPDGVGDVDAFDAATAYNAQTNQTLVVFEADDVGDRDNNYVIFGHFVDAAGNPVGADFEISSPPDPVNARDEDPDVAYNSTRNEFLVAWESTDPATEGRSILVRRLSATGAAIGSAVTIAATQPGDGQGNGFLTYGDVKVAFNSRDDAYLAAFDRFGGQSAEVGARRITGEGQPTGDEITVSEDEYDDGDPDVAYNSADNQFLVAWEGLVVRADESLDSEIKGQRLGADGGELGGDFQISSVGPEDQADYFSGDAAVAYNSSVSEYLVVFEGTRNIEEEDAEQEIYGQRLVAGTGAEPAPEFRISNHTRPAGETDAESFYDATDPDLAFNSGANEYLVVWEIDASRAGTGDEGAEEEVSGQRVAANGSNIGGAFEISNMLPDGNHDFDAEDPATAYNSRTCEYVAAWEGTRAQDGDGDEEEEIYGRRVAGAACPDLAIAKEDAPDPVGVGQNITYTLVVSNNGPTSASGVVVRDELPAGVTFVSATSSQGACTGTAAVECALGAIGNAGSAQVTIVVRADSAGTIANTASVALDQVDRDAANNQATTQTTVTQEQQAGSDLRLTVDESQDPVDLGETLTYRVTVTNGGPGAASGITLTDTIPGSARFVSARAGGASARAAGGAQAAQAGSCTGRSTVRCSLGSLAPGASTTARIRVRPRRVGRIRNTASVTAQQADQSPANNSVVTRTRVVDRTGPRTRVAGCAARGAIRIVARDVSGVRRLSVFFRGSRIGRARGASITVRLPALELSARQRRVRVVATDGRGNRSRRSLQFPRCRPRFTG